MRDIKDEIIGWVRDLVEVVVIIGLIIIFSRLFLGAHILLPLVVVTSCSMYHQGSLWNGAGCHPYSSVNWDSWLISHNISKEKISGFPFQNGFSMGDMVLTITPDGKGVILPIFPETRLGDVVIYNRDRLHKGNEPIIHRVVGIVRIRNWEINNSEGTLDCLTYDDFNRIYIPYIKKCITGEYCPYRDFPKSGDFNFYITKGDNNMYSDQCGANRGIALPVTDRQLIARGFIRIPYIGWLKIALNKIIPI